MKKLFKKTIWRLKRILHELNPRNGDIYFFYIVVVGGTYGCIIASEACSKNIHPFDHVSEMTYGYIGASFWFIWMILRIILDYKGYVPPRWCDDISDYKNVS